MSKRGRRPTPTKLRVLRGNPSQRALNDREPDPPTIDGKVKPTFPLSSYGLSCWERLIENLAAVKLLTVMDVDVLTRYCNTLDEYHLAVVDVRKQGRTVTRRTMHDEVKVTNPRFSQMQQLSRDLLRLESEFGLTPSYRISVVGQKKEVSATDWEEFLFVNLRE